MEKFVNYLRGRKLDNFEIYFQEIETSPVVFEQNSLQTLEQKSISGIGIRIVKDRYLGYTATTDLRNPKESIDFAIEAAMYGEEVKFSLPKKTEYPQVKTYYPAEWSETERIKLGNEIIKTLTSLWPDLQLTIELISKIKKINIINSQDLVANYEKSVYSLQVVGFVVLATGFTWVEEEMSSLKILEDTLKIMEKLKPKLTLAKNLAPGVKSGKFPVLFTPRALPSLLEVFNIGLNGKTVAQNISPLANRLGDQIAGEELTLKDDGTYPYLLGTRPFDDEGIPVEPRVLIERGILRGYLLDLKSASKLNLSPTGNATRSYESMPVPAFNNLVLQPGQKPLKEILKEIKRGIWVESVIGGGQSNLLAGDFSLNIGLGFLIENGEIVGRVKDSMIAGNTYEIFRQPFVLSSEVETVGNGVLPYAIFSSLPLVVKE